MNVATPIPFIVNPTSGGGRGGRTARLVAARLDAAGFPVQMQISRDRDDLAVLMAAAVRASHPLVLVCGGDGTIRSAANALARTDAVLGLVPAGRGNDLARALGYPIRPKAIGDFLTRLLWEGVAPRRIDLGLADETYFATVATFGVDSEIAERVHRSRRGRRHRLVYLTQAIRGLIRYRPRFIRLSGDFGTRELDVLLCATANTPHYGSWFHIAPEARLDDGLFHVCIIGAISSAEALRLVPRAIRGTHVGHPAVEILVTRELTIESDRPARLYADGEYLAETPTRLRVVPGALRVLARESIGAV